MCPLACARQGEPDADRRAALRCTFACEVRATAEMATAAGAGMSNQPVARTKSRRALAIS
jgi:hypothetical protein